MTKSSCHNTKPVQDSSLDIPAVLDLRELFGFVEGVLHPWEATGCFGSKHAFALLLKVVRTDTTSCLAQNGTI